MPCFVAPDNMIEAVRMYLNKPDLPLCDVLSSVYHSLAESYKTAVEEIEKISQKEINSINIVGGSWDRYLNLLTAQYTGKKVYTGLTEARKIIKTTFEIKEAGT